MGGKTKNCCKSPQQIPLHLCHILKPPSFLFFTTTWKKDFDHPLHLTQKKKMKTESGHKSWGFSHEGMQSGRKMR